MGSVDSSLTTVALGSVDSSKDSSLTVALSLSLESKLDSSLSVALGSVDSSKDSSLTDALGSVDSSKDSSLTVALSLSLESKLDSSLSVALGLSLESKLEPSLTTVVLCPSIPTDMLCLTNSFLARGMSVVNGDVVDVQHESTLTAAATPKNFILVVVKVSSDPVLNSPLKLSSDEEECDRQRRGLPARPRRASLK